jgi:hypothetical protein
MSNPIDAFINAGGTSGAPTAQDSRYYGSSTLVWTRPDGTPVRYLQRRIIPQPERYSVLRQYVVAEGDRLDNIASSQLGDPLLFWILCDANAAVDPEDLTSQIGRTLLVTLPAGIGTGSRNG